MTENSPDPQPESSPEQVIVPVAVVWIICAILEVGLLHSVWLMAAFFLMLVILLLIVKLREKNDLTQFADRTAAAWRTESKTLQMSAPHLDVVLATDAEPAAVIEALQYFLQTSDWGAWKFESGNEARSLYRRGAWLGTPPHAQPNFFSKYFGFRRMTDDDPAPGTPTTPSSAGMHYYQLGRSRLKSQCGPRTAWSS